MFGILVALGVIIGDRIVVAQGQRRGLDPNDVKYMNARIVIGGFIVAHLVSVIFYYPERIAENWKVLINPFAGLSSFGGFLGAFIAFLYFTKKAEIDRLRYADSVALGLAVGWIFGRTGCFTAHDHPGLRVPASFFLSVKYPEGPRIDLGLYELLFTIVMTADPLPVQPQAAPARADHRARGVDVRAGALRARLPARHGCGQPRRRYLVLTPAQWACLATAALGVYLWRRGQSPAAAAPEQPARRPPTDSPISAAT